MSEAPTWIESGLSKMWIDHLVVGKPGECWSWAASHQGGYPQAMLRARGDRKDKPTRVHRLVAGLVHGNVTGPVHHACGNKGCLNPDHLVPTGSHREHFQFHLRTHCQRGHLLQGRDLYITPSGDRQCQACRRRRQREYIQRKKVRA